MVFEFLFFCCCEDFCLEFLFDWLIGFDVDVEVFVVGFEGCCYDVEVVIVVDVVDEF